MLCITHWPRWRKEDIITHSDMCRFGVMRSLQPDEEIEEEDEVFRCPEDETALSKMFLKIHSKTRRILLKHGRDKDGSINKGERLLFSGLEGTSTPEWLRTAEINVQRKQEEESELFLQDISKKISESIISDVLDRVAKSIEYKEIIEVENAQKEDEADKQQEADMENAEVGIEGGKDEEEAVVENAEIGIEGGKDEEEAVVENAEIRIEGGKDEEEVVVENAENGIEGGKDEAQEEEFRRKEVERGKEDTTNDILEKLNSDCENFTTNIISSENDVEMKLQGIIPPRLLLHFAANRTSLLTDTGSRIYTFKHFGNVRIGMFSIDIASFDAEHKNYRYDAKYTSMALAPTRKFGSVFQMHRMARYRYDRR